MSKGGRKVVVADLVVEITQLTARMHEIERRMRDLEGVEERMREFEGADVLAQMPDPNKRIKVETIDMARSPTHRIYVEVSGTTTIAELFGDHVDSDKK